jgi:hypothetical protein
LIEPSVVMRTPRHPLLRRPWRSWRRLTQAIGSLAWGNGRRRRRANREHDGALIRSLNAVSHLEAVELQLRVCLNTFIRIGCDREAVKDVLTSLEALGRVLSLHDIDRLAALGYVHSPDLNSAVFKLALAVLASRGRPNEAEVARALASGVPFRKMDEINSTVVTTVLARHLQQVGSSSPLETAQPWGAVR